MSKRYPEPVVGAFILNSQDQILLARSPKWQQGKIWAVPGGHIEWGESIETAVKREILEEVGLTVDFERTFYLQEAIFPKHFHQKRHFIFIECLCHASEPIKLKLDQKEIIEAQWYDLKTALTLPSNPYTLKAIKQLLH